MDLLQPIVCADSNHVRETMNHNNDETTMGRVFVKPTVHDVLCGRGKVRLLLLHQFYPMYNVVLSAGLWLACLSSMFRPGHLRGCIDKRYVC